MEKDIERFLRGFTPLEQIGDGSFGKVYKCVKKDTNETVAVKIPAFDACLKHELYIMNKLTNLDQQNIVRFIDSFRLRRTKRIALVFELLDVSLLDYLNEMETMNLHEIRSVIQQMATAFDALKTIGVIHADLKSDNIMVVDRKAQPLRVKLIDFGQSVLTSKVKRGDLCQIPSHRAPEVILGLRFSEAIDMWSLGVVMADMVLSEPIFPDECEYEVMWSIVEFMGVPSDHLLNHGVYTEDYFVQMPSGEWRLKTRLQYYTSNFKDSKKNCNMEYLKTFPWNGLIEVEDGEKKECMDLLKALLEMDLKKRITPSEVLDHPFITRHPHQQSAGTNETSGTASALPPAVPSTEPPQTESRLTASEEDANSVHGWTSVPLYPGAILVQPAPGAQSPVEYPRESKCDPPPILKAVPSTEPPQTESRLTASPEDANSVHGWTPDPLYPGAILVQPAPGAQSPVEYPRESKCDPPPILKAVPSTEPPQTESRLTASSEDVTCSSATRGLHGWTLDPLYPGAILVQPAPGEQSPVEYPRESKCDPPPIPKEDSNMEQEHKEIPSTTSDDMEPKKKTKKKKKNCFKRVFSWAKKTFCCSVTVDDD